MEPLFGVLLSCWHEMPEKGKWVVACLQGAWPRLLGDRLASVCRPVSFRNSELEIEISGCDWEDAVRNIQPALLEKLRTATAGEVASLSIRKAW